MGTKNIKLHINTEAACNGLSADRALAHTKCATPAQASFGGRRCTLGCDRNRMQYLSKASNIIQTKYILYDITDFT